MPRKLGLLASLVAALLSVQACGGGTSTSSSNKTATGPDSKAPIVIGGAVALTGPISSFDLPQDAVMQAAVNRINAAGGVDGHKLKLIFVDTKSDITAGASAAQQLIGEGAQIIVTSPDYNFGRAAAQVAQQNGKLVLAGAGSPDFGKQGIGELAFNVGRSIYSEGATSAEYSYQKLGFRKAYTLLDPSLDYDTRGCSAFDTRWKQLGGQIVGANTYASTDTSFASQVAALRNDIPAPDVVVLCGYLPAEGTLIRQIREGGINAALFSFASMDGSFWLSAVPHLSNFYYLPYASLYGDDPDPQVNQIVKAAEKILGGPLDTGNSFIGYRQIQLIAWALQQTGGNTDGAALAAKLEHLTNFSTPIGPLTFAPNLHFDNVQPVRISEITNGQHKLLTIWNPEKVPPMPGF